MDSIEKAIQEVKIESGAVAKMIVLAEAAIIKGQPELEAAASHLSGVKGYLKGIEAKYKHWTEGLNQSLKRIRDDYNPVKAAAQKAEAIWKGKITAYHTEQERQIALQQAKAREAADKERLRLEEQAKKLDAKGKPDQAEAKREVAAATPTPVFAGPPKIAGTYFKEKWVYEVEDEALIPREFWIVDHKKLGGVVEDMKGTKDITGIRQYPKKIPVSR